MKLTDQEMLRNAYAAYNGQDSDALLELVSENVNWPNGGARVYGKDDLRSYWGRQWSQTRTHDELIEITELAPNKYVVRIRQIVRALDGSVISRGEFDHVHHLNNGLIVRMDIQKITPAGDENFQSPASTD